MKQGRGRKDHVDKSRRIVSVMCHGRELHTTGFGNSTCLLLLVTGRWRSTFLRTLVFGLSDIHTYTRTMYTIYVYSHIWICVWVQFVAGYLTLDFYGIGKWVCEFTWIGFVKWKHGSKIHGRLGDLQKSTPPFEFLDDGYTTHKGKVRGEGRVYHYLCTTTCTYVVSLWEFHFWHRLDFY